MNTPLVSVLMASYNPGRYLRAAVESVLGQTYENIELILIDDGSTDQSLDEVGDLLKDPRIRLLSQRNAGKPTALNRALDIASGEYYAIQDADDISYPTRIERQVETMLSEPDLACVMCGHDLIIGDDVVGPTSRFKDREQCRGDIAGFKLPAHDPTVMYRCAKVKDVRYEPDLPIVEGWDYILRVGERFPMMVIGECLYSYRVHQASITKSMPAERWRLMREVLERACARRGHRYVDVFGEQFLQMQRTRNRDLDNNLAVHFIESVLDLRSDGRKFAALKTGLHCAALQPLEFHYYKALAYAMLPRSVVARYRAFRRSREPSVPVGDTQSL
jgi:glycosyltransferase involved in cell wall biosynthesis